MYGDSWFVHFHMVIISVLYMVETEPPAYEWRLNHIHSMNHAEVINASLSDSSV